MSLYFSALDPMSLYFGLHPRRWDRVSVIGEVVGEVGRSERSGIVHDDVLLESVFAVVESWPRSDAPRRSMPDSVRRHPCQMLAIRSSSITPGLRGHVVFTFMNEMSAGRKVGVAKWGLLRRCSI